MNHQVTFIIVIIVVYRGIAMNRSRIMPNTMAAVTIFSSRKEIASNYHEGYLMIFVMVLELHAHDGIYKNIC